MMSEASSDKWWLRYEGDQPAIDDLPTSSRAAEVRTALRMVDREREIRAELRAEVVRLRSSLEQIAALNLPYRDTANRARSIARRALEDGPGALVGADAGTAQHNTTNPEGQPRGET